MESLYQAVKKRMQGQKKFLQLGNRDAGTQQSNIL